MSPFRGERVTSRDTFRRTQFRTSSTTRSTPPESSISMMFNLIADVSRKLSRIGFAHTERRVSRLPREAAMQDTILTNPLRILRRSSLRPDTGRRGHCRQFSCGRRADAQSGKPGNKAPAGYSAIHVILQQEFHETSGDGYKPVSNFAR